MGQKTNPISLRLNINRSFESSWFADNSFEYGKLLHQDLKIRQYVKSLFQYIGIQTGRINIQIFSKKLVIHYFFHQPDDIKDHAARENIKWLTQLKNGHDIGQTTSSVQSTISNNIVDTQLQISGNKILLNDLNRLSLKTPRIANQHNYNRKRSELYVQADKFGNNTTEMDRVKNFLVRTPSKLVNTLHTSNESIIPNLKHKQGRGTFLHASPVKSMNNFLDNNFVTKSFLVRFSILHFYLSQNKFYNKFNYFLKYFHFLEYIIANKKNSMLTVMLPKQQDTSFNTPIEATLSNMQLFYPIRNSGDKISSRTTRIENYGISRKNYIIDDNLSRVESIIATNYSSNTLILPIKIDSKYKSASFISQYIAHRLQQNISFRQIYKQLLNDIKAQNFGKLSKDTSESNVSYDNKVIQGMRIHCSGRLGGVEMARVESKKYGQTSLHVFSSKIDFATSEAYTSFGIIGIKVWISYR